MKKCKNIECNNEVKENRIYCSLKCRNVYVNKHLRDYTKVSDGLKANSRKKYKIRHCNFIECGNIITYDKRTNKIYCSHSCNAKANNSKRKGLLHNVTEEGLESWKKSLKKRTENRRSEYIKQPKECFFCKKALNYENRKHKFCGEKCEKLALNLKRQKNMSDFFKYKQETLFKFSLNSYPDEFDFELVKKHGWYSPTNKKNNLNGVSRDHMLSVREGFNLNIDPKLIAHPANCRLILQRENSGKHMKSIITKNELIERINLWNIKYK